MQYKSSLIATYLILFSAFAVSNNWDEEIPLNIYTEGYIYESRDRTDTIEDILRLKEDSWKKTETENFSESFSQSDFWLLRTFSDIDFTREQKLLSAKMPLQDYISVWFLDQNNKVIKHFQTGDRLPFNTREIESRFFAFSLPKQKLKQLKIVMKFSTHDGMFEPGPVLIENASEYFSEMLIQYMIYGFLYGGMFILGLYNLFLFVSHKDKQFLLYFLFITSYFFYNLTLRGFSAQYLFPQAPDIANQFKGISLSIGYFTLYLFVTNILATKKHYPRSHLIYTLIISSLVIPFIYILNDQYAQFYKIIITPAILVLLSVIYFSALGSIRGDRTSKILLMAWAVLATGGILYTFSIMGIIEPNAIIFYSIDIGSTFEGLILAFALGDKLNQLRDKHDASNALLIESQKNYSQQMEKTVEERTLQLKNARDEAEAANQKKNMFLANISHEIRTPMNGVLSLLKVLRRTDLSYQQHEYINMIERSGNRMVILLNDLLDISLIQEKIKPELSNLSLAKLVTEVVESFKESALSKKLTLELVLPDELPNVSADHKLLEQLLSNLISNAIKYTNTGQVIVSVDPTLVSTNEAVCVFTIEDTGIGIPTDLQEKVFERFYQIDESYSRNQDGLGLGLTICKQIVSILGTELKLDSTANKGSKFSFSLRLAITDNLSEIPEATDCLGISRKLKVLLVEDEPIGRLAARCLLEDEGHKVDEAHNGLEALAMLEVDCDYDAILMDVHMPEMDGLEATRKIREHTNPQINESLIVGLTASVSSSEKANFISAGMNAVAHKPFDLQKLGIAIEENLKIID